MPLIRTVGRPTRVEIDKIKGSRFIGTIAPAQHPEQALAAVQEVRDAYPDARHHAFAWRLGVDETRFNDAGEPNGSAGRPILARILGVELFGTLVVVTRYFGGTKLGVGGLIRAYGGCAAAVIEAAKIVERPQMSEVRISFAYGLSGAVDRVTAAHEGHATHSDYGAEVRRAVSVPLERLEGFLRGINEAGRGQVEVTLEDEMSIGSAKPRS